jgi:hypothetical protein
MGMTKYRRGQQGGGGGLAGAGDQGRFQTSLYCFVGQALSHATDEEKARVLKLMDIAYLLAKEEMPFKKFGAIVNLEKRHGVHLGDTYNNSKAAAEFTTTIGAEIEDNLKTALDKVDLFSICCDGSTDVSIIEKELIYVKFINDSGVIENHILGLKDIKSANAGGLKATIRAKFSELGITDFQRNWLVFALTEPVSILE